MNKKSLNNHLLIAMPHLKDTIFNKSVILICDHNKEGTMGFITNKPIIKNKISDELFEKFKSNIYFGGPVSIETCYIIHDNKYALNDSNNISNQLLFTSTKQIVKDIEKGCGPKKFKFHMGYAGWTSGQIEEEIKNGDWLAIPNPKNFIFDISDEEKWLYAINKLGIDLQDYWSTISGQA